MKRPIISILLTLSFATISLFYSCEEKTGLVAHCNCFATAGKTCVSYEETYCADPWGAGYIDDNELVDDIRTYLGSFNIDFHVTTIANTSPPESCEACFCKSGRTICGWVANADLQEIKAIGFKEQ